MKKQEAIKLAREKFKKELKSTGTTDEAISNCLYCGSIYLIHYLHFKNKKIK